MRTVRPSAVGIALVLLAACSPAAEAPVGRFDAAVAARPDDTAAPRGEPIRVGGTLGLTGTFSQAAEGYAAAYDLWAEHVNGSGGLLGRPVELLVYDDQSDPDTAASLYERLIRQDEVDLLLAPDITTIEAVLPLAARHAMVLFAGAPVPPATLARSRWTVGVASYGPADHVRGVFEMIDDLPPERRPRRIGVATARHPLTMAIRDDPRHGVRALARAHGLSMVVDRDYPGTDADLGGVVAEAQARGVDVFLGLSLADDAAAMARAAEAAGFEPDLYCACGPQVTSLPLWRDLGAAADGVLSPAAAWSGGDDPGNEELRGFARSRLGRPDPPVPVTTGYAILQVLAQAVEGVGGLDQRALREYVTGRTFRTAAGPIAYGSDGLPRPAAVLLQYQGDRNQVVWPPERATAALLPAAD